MQAKSFKWLASIIGELHLHLYIFFMYRHYKHNYKIVCYIYTIYKILTNNPKNIL